MPTKYFSTTEIATMLGVSREYINRLCREKKLGRRVGRNWAISRSSLNKYLARRDARRSSIDGTASATMLQPRS